MAEAAPVLIIDTSALLPPEKVLRTKAGSPYATGAARYRYTQTNAPFGVFQKRVLLFIQAGLKLMIFLHLLSAEITGVDHHSWFHFLLLKRT